MSKGCVRWEVEQHIKYLLQRHGLVGPEAQQAKDYMDRGYTNEAAIRLAKANGDHKVLLRRAA